jgi:hypothetical protein
MGIHKPIDKSQGYAGHRYRKQSERLGVEPAEIEAAILRGWTGDVIAELPASRASELAGPPMWDPEIEATLEKIKSAPVVPLRLDYETKRRLAVGRRR